MIKKKWELAQPLWSYIYSKFFRHVVLTAAHCTDKNEDIKVKILDFTAKQISSWKSL
jgi:hypothetical protein